MPSNTRATNQYYGKYRECCVVAHLNQSDVEYHEDYSFTAEEQKILFDEAKLIADFLGDHTATYIGNYTANESGDILLDTGDTVEIKTVSAGSGTYFNTSIYYFTKFGFDFKQYMEENGLYDAIEQSFGSMVSVSRKNNSPVNLASSSLIRHNYQNKWEEKIVPIDKIMRMKFTQDIANYFAQNPDRIYEFISDMLNKNSVTSKKSSPDRLIVLNYRNRTVREINLKTFKDNISTNIRTTDSGLVIGKVRIAFSWQNGIGLNNPTIRAYLED
jgi:hypothetical protein